MKILEFMSFDLGWFLTTPGMLITGGVIVLLIALIVFISSNKKRSKNKNVAADYGLETAPTTVPDMGQPIMGNNEVPGMGMQMPNQMGMDAVAPVSDINQNVTDFQTISTPDVQSVNNVPSVPDTNANNAFINFDATPSTVPTPEATVVPDISFIQPNGPTFNEEPAVAIPDMSATQFPGSPTLTPIDSSQNSNSVVDNVAPTVGPSIYGGANPGFNQPISDTPASPVIYGGANPLEKTMPIPTISNNTANTVTSMGETAKPLGFDIPNLQDDVAPTLQPVSPDSSTSFVPPVQEPVTSNSAEINNVFGVPTDNQTTIETLDF